jgi:hypothetical protein
MLPEVPASEEARDQVSAKMVHPALNPELIHHSIYCGVASLAHFPFLDQFFVGTPSYLATQGAALHFVKVRDCIAFGVEEFSPIKLAQK